jgi:CHRD domain
MKESPEIRDACNTASTGYDRCFRKISQERNMLRNFIVSFAASTLVWASPASAEIIEYRAKLNGQSTTIDTGSAARASAKIMVDTISKTVAVRLKVIGLSVDSLSDALVEAPIGPIHFHQYANGDLADAGNSALAFPIAFGPSYEPTRRGFRVDTGGLDYASAVAPLGQALSFEDFVAALDKGTVILNIHTDAFGAGEINGVVAKVS